MAKSFNERVKFDEMPLGEGTPKRRPGGKAKRKRRRDKVRAANKAAKRARKRK